MSYLGGLGTVVVAGFVVAVRLAYAREMFVVVVAAVAALAVEPVAGRAVVLHRLVRLWGPGVEVREDTVRGRVRRAVAPAVARVRPGSGAAWADSRRRACRCPTGCREGRAPLHLCKARRALSYLE